MLDYKIDMYNSNNIQLLSTVTIYRNKMNLSREYIKESEEYENLTKVMKEVSSLLNEGVIKDFTNIPCDTATRINNAVRNILELIFAEEDIYSGDYWLNRIVEDAKNDYKRSEVNKILGHFLTHTDQSFSGACDYYVPGKFCLLPPYINGNKMSDIEGRSMFGQMMIKLTTERDLQKMGLRMVYSSYYSGSEKSEYFISEYLIRPDKEDEYEKIHNNPDRYDKYKKYFEDQKIECLLEKVKEHYIDVLNY